MAAYTSSQAGNWSSASTWGGAGVPTDGDTATVSHAVTVDANSTIGTSPNDTTTNVLTINSSGSLTISTGVTLTCKGNLLVNPSSVTAGLTINGSGRLLFDGSANGTSRIYILTCSTNGRLNLAGTNANARATVESTTGGGIWRLAPVTVSLATANWGLMIRCGNQTNNGFTNNSTATSGQTISIQNTIFRDCAGIRIAAGHATATVLIRDCQFTGSTATLTDQLTGFAGASFTVDRCTWDRTTTWFLPENIVVTNCYFSPQMVMASGGGFAAGSGNNLYMHTGSPGTWRGPMNDLYYFHNQADNLNYLCMNFTCTGANQEIKNNVMDYGDSSIGQPDGFVVVACTTGQSYKYTGNIKLPDSAGTSSGALCNFLPSATFSGTVQIEHNTVAVTNGTQDGVFVGEVSSSLLPAGFMTSLKSNLFWSPATASPGFKFIRHTSSTVQDYVSSANADYNWGWNLAAGNNTRGYQATNTGTTLFSSGTPDNNGGNGDPSFVDSTRNLLRFDRNFLGNPAATAWADATVYAVGDVVSAATAGYCGGDTLNWRCITAHTSNAANATNGKPGSASGFRTNWEPMSLFRLREDPTRITQLLTWVRAGFAVRNAALNTSHDGAPVGAGAYTPLGRRRRLICGANC